MVFRKWGGLRIALPFDVLDFAPDDDRGEGPADVEVLIGKIAAPSSALTPIDVRQSVGPGAYLFRRPGIATYLVEDGARITICPEPGVSEATVAAYLLGRPLAALAYQRGWLSIHGGAIDLGRGAFVFAGPAGTGKSTLLSAFDHRGYSLLSDDAALIRDGESRVEVWPTSHRFRLNPDSLARLPAGARQAAPVREDFVKMSVPFARAIETPLPLAGIFLLNRTGSRIAVETLNSVEAIKGLTENLNRPVLADIIRGRNTLFRQVAAIVDTTPVHRLTLPDDLSRLEEVVAAIETYSGWETAAGASRDSQVDA